MHTYTNSFIVHQMSRFIILAGIFQVTQSSDRFIKHFSLIYQIGTMCWIYSVMLMIVVKWIGKLN